MKMPGDLQTTSLDAALCSYIDRAVAAAVQARSDDLAEQQDQQSRGNNATIVVFSNDMDKLWAAFAIATGAASTQMQVSMFFTFWGLTAIKKKTVLAGKTLTEKLMAVMSPSGPADVGTSKMNMLGIGPAFFKYVMKNKHLSTLPEMIALAGQLGIRMVACQTSMDVMGIKKEELIDGLEFGGVAAYLADAAQGGITLFI